MKQNILQYKFVDKLKALSFVDEIWLFGSRARGDNQERSDIDLAIICTRATAYNWLKVEDVIEDADTLLKIDCVKLDKERIGDELWMNILKDKKVVYAKNANQV